jgi:hypothetical protein
MKFFTRTVVLAAVLVAPILSFAQEADMRTEQPQQTNDVRASGYGGATSGADQAGSQRYMGDPWHGNGSNAAGSKCVGPVSYCTVFFGS